VASTPVQTVVSVRLDPQTLQRLQEAADAAGRSRSGYAVNLIRAGLSGALPSLPNDVHPLVAETFAVFARVEGPDVKARLEGALILARVGAAGGAPAVAAVRALNLIFDEIDTLTADDTFGDFLSIPTTPIVSIA
jgi:Ribbon-helix-helix protein, copG family